MFFFFFKKKKNPSLSQETDNIASVLMSSGGRSEAEIFASELKKYDEFKAAVDGLVQATRDTMQKVRVSQNGGRKLGFVKKKKGV